MTTTNKDITRTAWTGWTPAQGFPLPGGPGPDDRVSFVLRLGRSLHTSGYAAHRLEEALELTCDRLGLQAQIFSMPTSIMVSFGPQDDQRTFLIRVEPGESNLGKLAQTDEVTREVLSGQLTPLEGSRRLEAIELAPPPYPVWLTTAAFAIASGSSARFLGGGWHEMVAGLGIGLAIGLLSLVTTRIAGLNRVFEPVAALTASLLAAGVAWAGFPISVFIATLAGVIVLIPGLTLTTAMTEISTRHLAAGTARLMGAIVLLLGITFGIALGSKLGVLVLGKIVSTRITPLPEWTLFIAVFVSALAFIVLLKAEGRDAPWIIPAGALAIIGSRFGGDTLGPELGAFVGALAVGIGANWYARITNRSSQIVLVPGLLMLVPGSIGLRSLTSLLDKDVIVGVEGAFRMILIAVSLVSGILIAQIVSPKRKLLG